MFTLPKFYVEYDVYNLEEHVEYKFIMFARTTAGDSEIAIAQETTLEARKWGEGSGECIRREVRDRNYG